MSAMPVKAAPPPPLPPKERRRGNAIQGVAAATAMVVEQPAATQDREDDHDDAATVDSGMENNRNRRSVNQMAPTSAFNRLSRMVKTSATKVFQSSSSASHSNSNRRSMAIHKPEVPVPIPPKMKVDEHLAAPMLSDAPPPAKKERTLADTSNHHNNNRKSFFQRVSARLRPTKNPMSGPLFASATLAMDHPMENGNQPQGGDEPISPRYQDLPSLLEFYVEDEERAELLDCEEPKINGSSIIVFAFGEGTIQTGLGSSEAGPDAIYPSLAGEPQSFNVRVMDGVNEKNPIKFGEDAACRRGIYALEWFNDTENGKPKYNLVGDAMAYNSAHILRRALKQDAVIFPMNLEMSLERKTKMLALCFEKVGARAVRVCSEEKMALQYVTGESNPTGIIVDIGHSKTRCVAIVDGEVADITLKTSVSAGKMMTYRMFCLLKQRTAMFDQNVTGTEFAREAKEKHAFAALHPPTDQELANNPRPFETVFHLKDGQDVTLGHERYVCAETLFQPEKDEGKLSYLKAPSLQQTIVDCLRANDRDIWNDLLKNVVVIGGVAQLPNLKQRLETELYRLLPPAHFRHLQLKVEPFAGWKGARLASLQDGDVGQWISRREWREGGETIIQQRLQEMPL